MQSNKVKNLHEPEPPVREWHTLHGVFPDGKYVELSRNPISDDPQRIAWTVQCADQVHCAVIVGHAGDNLPSACRMDAPIEFSIRDGKITAESTGR